MNFSSILVANRGEIARRVVRGARRLGLRVTVVYTDADRLSPVLGEADEALRLESGYLDGEAIIAAARRCGAQAIHPGYGYLSENAAFASAVEAAGLVWIGPPPAVIAAMGDKIAAKRAAVNAGVPVLPSTEDPAQAHTVGYPLLVKASAGGGGKGMRVVRSPGDLEESLAAARREAASSFGDDRVFLERYVERSRHVEIQILGDSHGGLVHLGERECSIQRRHQKLIEESPSPIVNEAMREAMGSAALGLARSLGYRSAGTVEFLVDDATRDFYFLEVNTRLQVEHPVTEEVTGIDLVREQIRVAQGLPLDLSAARLRPRGWAIEARLCAEDPARGFLPSTGTLAVFEPAATPRVRWESGVVSGSVVGVDFDPLLAKVIAHAPTRAEAAAAVASALERLHIGGVTTNRDLLAATLRHERFLAGDTTTDFIDRVDPPRAITRDEDELAWVLGAGALWLQGEHRANAPVLGAVPSGWRNARLPRQSTTFRLDGADHVVEYRARRDGAFDVGTAVARVHHWSERAIDLELDGRRRRARVTRAGSALYVQEVRGTAHLEVVARFAPPTPEPTPGGLHAPMPGVVTEVRVNVGDVVTAGQSLVVMEAMKMEHVISAPFAGVVRAVLVVSGQQVESGADLLAVDADEE